MDQRGIVIADKDAEYLTFAADFFQKAGYRVKTTDSAGEALNNILGKDTTILLLGSGFTKGVSSASLIHLLRTFNRHLHIILVSDEISLNQERKVREEGIFYHAMKPATVDDMKELEQAVACVFEQYPNSVLCEQVAESKVEPAPAAAVGKPAAGRIQLAKVLPWVLGVVALAVGVSYLSLSAVTPGQSSTSVTTWVFLAFCGLIVVGQLLPIFRVKLAVKWEKARHMLRGK